MTGWIVLAAVLLVTLGGLLVSVLMGLSAVVINRD